MSWVSDGNQHPCILKDDGYRQGRFAALMQRSVTPYLSENFIRYLEE
ncbi:hypothetical protein IOK_11922 [Yersinia enterocolitica subsp. palearctica PhRBD_Ye1]|nr:hypothetical protein IOK_11922 [Yersinia enterocolitica subsp. palearctica PhRBD_Ye1]